MKTITSRPLKPSTRTATAVIIGGGHAGLAMSHCLTGHGIDHVVLESGEVGNSWRTERWDSLRLLTPNWLSRLPGYAWQGGDPDGFMTMPDVIDFITGYARFCRAPVLTGTRVLQVLPRDDGYRVLTDRGVWWCRAVVMANGAFRLPAVPGVSEGVPEHIAQLTPRDYRNPDSLPAGGVLVVGASATGLQLADELNAAGRRVTLAVGEHVRMPRSYRGLDIQHWLQVTGLLDERYDAVDDIVRARRVPSPQLIGTPERATLDLNALTDRGVALIGRLAGVSNGKAQFSGGLKNTCAMADLKLGRLCGTIDQWAAGADLADAAASAEAFEPTRVPDAPRLGIDLNSGELASIVWATGYLPDYGWLEAPVFDRRGQLAHDGGVLALPGLYALGLTFMRRRKSSFIHGAQDDARELAAHMAGWLAGAGRRDRISLAS